MFTNTLDKNLPAANSMPLNWITQVGKPAVKSKDVSSSLESTFLDKPYNPMVNAGSIVVNSLLQCLMKPEMSMAEKFDYVNNYIKVREKVECFVPPKRGTKMFFFYF